MDLRRDWDASSEQENIKSKKPPNTAFRQQRLKSWQPILLPQNVLPSLILLACIFIPVGVGFILGAKGIQQLEINYGGCHNLAVSNNYVEIPRKYTSSHFKSSLNKQPQWRLIAKDNGDLECDIRFEIPNDIHSGVYLYYKLTKFYQNHRRYVNSFDFKQLSGKAVEIDELSSNCSPLKSTKGKIIYPCGLIANSLFNDTFSSRLTGSDGTDDYELTNKGISWRIDRKNYKKTNYKAENIVPPPNWQKRFPDGYTEDNIPDLGQWEELQVWMRTPPLPSFYKLALKNESTTLPKGNYSFTVGLNYPTSLYGGSKSIVLTTNRFFGGRNMSLGALFVISGGIVALAAIFLILKLLLKPRALGDHAYLNFEENDEVSFSRSNIPEIL